MILSPIGASSGKCVFLARDMLLGKKRVVKLLSVREPEEAELYKRLDHPFLPQLFDCITITEKETLCLVIQYIPGRTLGALSAEKNGFSKRELLLLGMKICTIMDYLHSRRPPVIHGDLKPDNLLLSSLGQLYLIDLGSAVIHPGRRTGFTGTRGFAAPEQYEGPPCPASDIYGFGKTMAYLSGEMSFSPLEELIRSCCKSDPSSRIQSFSLIREQLAAIYTDFIKSGICDLPERRNDVSGNLI